MDKKTFFTADTHFGHSNIIKFESRPFQDVDEMDGVLIERWNEVVRPQDEIFVLGDFSLYEKDKTTEIVHRLNGTKILVMGNHDTQTSEYYLECGFDQVSQYPIVVADFWILSHYPMYVNQNMPYANIFGHVHSSKVYRDYTGQSFCVCVERWDYRPIEYSEMKRLMKEA